MRFTFAPNKNYNMKALLLSIFAAASLATANAQLQYGVKAGVNMSNLTGDATNDYKSRTGFNAGMFLEIPVSKKFSVKPELVYSLQGAKSDGVQDIFPASTLKTGYVNIPVLAKYNIISGLFAETGPQIGFLTSAKNDFDGTDHDVKDVYKTTDFSWAFGLGYELPFGLGVNARYNTGISKIVEEQGKWRNSIFQVGLFYKIRSQK
jgi:hypothetical protein